MKPELRRKTEICRQWRKLGPSKEKLGSPKTLFRNQNNTGLSHKYSGVAIFHFLCGLQCSCDEQCCQIPACLHCYSRKENTATWGPFTATKICIHYFPCCCLLSCRRWGVIGWCFTAWFFIRNSSVDELLCEHSRCSLLCSCSARDWDGKDYLRIIPRVVW